MIFRQSWRYLYVLVQNIRSGEFVGLGGSDTDLTRRVGRPSPGRVSSISLNANYGIGNYLKYRLDPSNLSDSEPYTLFGGYEGLPAFNRSCHVPRSLAHIY